MLCPAPCDDVVLSCLWGAYIQLSICLLTLPAVCPILIINTLKLYFYTPAPVLPCRCGQIRCRCVSMRVHAVISHTGCHMGTAIKHPAPNRVKASFVIFDSRALWRSDGNSGRRGVNGRFIVAPPSPSQPSAGWLAHDRHRQTDTGDLIICPMLCYSNGTDKNQE